MKSDDSRSAKPGPKRSENRKMITDQVNLILESDIRVDTKGRGPEKEDQPQSVANPTAHSIECVTVNASDSGLSIYSEKPLKSGSRFIIYSGKIWDIPKHGTVIWCKKIAAGLYRAGILLGQNGEEPSGALLCAEETESFEGPDGKTQE